MSKSHPFREGNGRTRREFIRTLAIKERIELHLNPPNNKDIYERYIYGAISGNMELLAALILGI
ncbi:MAG: hypothetical protein FWD54_04700 [Endomicrobia bacterium]|nr:hypothetical protein [Endomicrobiia bacterium]